MSIRINDLTVTFQNRMKKNKVTAIDHASLEIPEGFTDFWEKTAPERLR